MSDYITHVETRSIGQLAREEIEAARKEGVDPMDIARTHQRLGEVIPYLLKQEEDAS